MANAWDADPVASPMDVALNAEGASPQLAAIARSMYQQESGSGKNTATSNAGAVGGAQIKPATFNSVADKGWSIHNPIDNARAGVRYLQQMFDKAGGDPTLTAVGYYGGPGAITKAQQGLAVSDPRNPNAPNTLQYGQQVAARVASSQQQQAAPQSGAGDAPWASDPIVQSPGGSAPSAPAASGNTGGFINGAINTLLHPIKSAENAIGAVGGGAVDFGNSLLNDPRGTTAMALRGAADGLSFGLSEKGLAAARAAINNDSYQNEVNTGHQEFANNQPAVLAGQLGSAFVPGVGELSLANRAVDAVPVASRGLKLLAGAGAGAAEGAAQVVGHADSPGDVTAGQVAAGMGLGALGGSVAGAVNPHTGDQMAGSFQKAFNKMYPGADLETTQRGAEIVQGLKAMGSRITQGDVDLQAANANQFANGYIQRAQAQVSQMADGPLKQQLASALNGTDGVSHLSDVGLNALRTSPEGNAVADAISMRQQAMAMTAATPSNPNPLLKLGRTAVDNGLLGLVTPHSAIGGVIADLAPVRNVVTNLLGGRETRLGNIRNWLAQGDNAEAFLAKNGTSQASQSAGTLQAAAAQAAQAQQAQQAAAAVAAQQAQAQAAQKAIANQGPQITNAQWLANQQKAVANQGPQISPMQLVQQRAAQAQQAQAAQATLAAQQAQAAAAQKAALASRQALADQQASDPTYLLGMSNPLGAPRNATEMGEFSKVMRQQAEAANVGPQQVTAVQQAAQQKALAKQALAQQNEAAMQQAQQVAESRAANVAAGNFSGMTFQKPALAAMMKFNNAPDLEAIKPTLAALASTHPSAAKTVAQLLTPGTRNLTKEQYYLVNDALREAHGAAEVPQVVERTPQATQGALSEASGSVQNPLAYKAGIAARQSAQKAALAAAQDPQVKKLITQMSTTSKVEDRASLFNDFMKGKSVEQQVEAKHLAEPLVTYGR